MMGHTHALSGCVAWLALTPAMAQAGTPLSGAEIVAGGLVCAGAALLPDLDHPSSTIAQTYGPVTWGLSKLVNTVSGGHRKATHSLLFAGLMGVGAQLLANVNELALQIVLFLLVGLALRGIGFGVPRKRLTSAVLNAVATLILLIAFTRTGVDYHWIGVAIALGCLVHLFGDALTEAGVPLFWPLKAKAGIPFGFETDGPVERWVVTPLLVVAVGFLGWKEAYGWLGTVVPPDWRLPRA
ncbi:MAG: metal-dependent hydrolase [Streptosporangiales bacterium]|nr:metal-dependent hydrolase [Streptosporangiales bacterium]